MELYSPTAPPGGQIPGCTVKEYLCFWVLLKNSLIVYSSASSDGTQGTEASQSTMDDIDMELVLQKTDVKPIKCKICLKFFNKSGRSEVLIQCDSCSGNSML